MLVRHLRNLRALKITKYLSCNSLRYFNNVVPAVGAPPPQFFKPTPGELSPVELSTLPVRFDHIARAHARIRHGVRFTGVERSHFLSLHTGFEVYPKREFQQVTGSFKERGARNALELLLNDPDPIIRENARKKGVIAASAGNHALALAYHGRQLGIPVTVIMPTTAPLTKVSKCRGFEANVVLHGSHIGEAKAEAQSNSIYEGMTYINGYDDPAIIAGAGTIGVELFEQIPKLDAVVIPVGGAGLIAGVSLALKTLNPRIHIIGVEPENCASFSYALQTGGAFTLPSHEPTLADGLAVPQVGPTSFEVARHFVDEVVTVSERLIALALLRCVEDEKVIVEGSGAIAVAPLLPGGPLALREDLKGKNVAVLLCGGNIDTAVLGRVIERGLAADGRLVRFVARVSDRPGGIAALTKVLSDNGASIKDIYHERAWLQSSVSHVHVKCVIETLSADHALQVRDALKSSGYPLTWGENAAVGKYAEELNAQLM